MAPGIGRARTRAVNAVLGVELQPLLLGLRDSLERIERWQEHARVDIDYLLRRHAAQLVVLRDQRDRIESLVEGLQALRATAAYNSAFDEREPLVSVRIASYQRFEIIVVNDGPNERTRDAVAALGDPRVHYSEFPTRNVYPDDAHARWMVAGSPGMNRGASLATGTWIAPLDEDDAFTPDHIERLLAAAVESRAELAYGALIQKNLVNGTESRIWSSPPAISEFSFQGALYLTALRSVFSYDEASWVVEEPGDWNLIRRMSAAGVTMTAIDDVVAVMNQVPYTHKPVE